MLRATLMVCGVILCLIPAHLSQEEALPAVGAQGEAAPSAPRDLTWALYDTLTLRWDAPEDPGGAAQMYVWYNIYWGTAPDNLTFYDSTDYDTDWYEAYGAMNWLVMLEDVFYYAVTAESEYGESGMSEVVEVNLTFEEWLYWKPPGSPQDLMAEAGPDGITLEWYAPQFYYGVEPLAYNVYRGSFLERELLTKLPAGVTSFTDRSAEPGTEYYYHVTALNSTHESDASAIASARAWTVPSAPYNLHTKVGDERIDLYWEPPSEDGGTPVTRYLIYRGTSSGHEEYYDAVDAAELEGESGVLRYRDDDVDAGKTYHYFVSAENDMGESEPSRGYDAEVEESQMDPCWMVGTFIVFLIILLIFAVQWVRGRRALAKEDGEAPGGPGRFSDYHTGGGCGGGWERGGAQGPAGGRSGPGGPGYGGRVGGGPDGEPPRGGPGGRGRRPRRKVSADELLGKGY